MRRWNEIFTLCELEDKSGFFQPQTWILEKNWTFRCRNLMKPLNFQTFRFGAVDSSFGVLQVPMVLNQLPQARVFDAFLRFSTVDVGGPFLSAEDALRQSAALPESYLWVASLQGCYLRTQVESVEVMPGQVWVSRKRELARIISKGTLLFLGQITSNHVFF